MKLFEQYKYYLAYTFYIDILPFMLCTSCKIHAYTNINTTVWVLTPIRYIIIPF